MGKSAVAAMTCLSVVTTAFVAAVPHLSAIFGRPGPVASAPYCLGGAASPADPSPLAAARRSAALSALGLFQLQDAHSHSVNKIKCILNKSK